MFMVDPIVCLRTLTRLCLQTPMYNHINTGNKRDANSHNTCRYWHWMKLFYNWLRYRYESEHACTNKTLDKFKGGVLSSTMFTWVIQQLSSDTGKTCTCMSNISNISGITFNRVMVNMCDFTIVLSDHSSIFNL